MNRRNVGALRGLAGSIVGLGLGALLTIVVTGPADLRFAREALFGSIFKLPRLSQSDSFFGALFLAFFVGPVIGWLAGERWDQKVSTMLGAGCGCAAPFTAIALLLFTLIMFSFM